MISVKILLFLSLCWYRVNTEDWEDKTYGKDWVVFISSEGKPHFVNLSIPVQTIKFQKHFIPTFLTGQPKFWLYNRNLINETEELLVPIQNKTNYIPKGPLVVVIHGWLSNRDGNSTQLIKNSILNAAHRNDNVIIMDWSSLQSWNYIHSAKETLTAAEKLNDFVQSLANVYQVGGSKIHLIGHSLGAHVAGLAGVFLKKNNLIISRVTGLDPARPFFEVPPVFSGISKDSGAFVDIIHTSIGILGIYKPAGHVDFYPGGGVNQPALCPSSILPGVCEHSAAYIYYQKSLTKKFEARKCHDYFIYTLGLCDKNEVQYMGEPCEQTAKGSYFLDIQTIST